MTLFWHAEYLLLLLLLKKELIGNYALDANSKKQNLLAISLVLILSKLNNELVFKTPFWVLLPFFPGDICWQNQAAGLDQCHRTWQGYSGPRIPEGARNQYSSTLLKRIGSSRCNLSCMTQIINLWWYLFWQSLCLRVSGAGVAKAEHCSKLTVLLKSI